MKRKKGKGRRERKKGKEDGKKKRGEVTDGDMIMINHLGYYSG